MYFNYLIILTLLYLFFGVSSVFAVTVTISKTPSTITDQPFNIDVVVSGAQANTTNYLRANLFPTGTTKYFGFTFNGSAFANSSDYSQYPSINIDSSGSWTGSIQAKLDSDSSYYSGPGNYSLKVRRYTQSGSSYTWSNEATLAVDLPTPSPTPTLTPTPTPTPTPSPTPKPSATSTPSVSSSVSKTKTTTPTFSPTPTPTLLPSPSSVKIATKITTSLPTVAGASKAAMPSASPISSSSANIAVANQKQINPFIIIGSLFVIIGISSLGFIIYKKR